MKILYTTFNTFPSNSANSVHILNMSIELKKRAKTFVLFVPKKAKPQNLKLGIDSISSNIKYGFYTNPQKIGMFIFIIQLLFFVTRHKPDFIISRHILSSILISFFRKNTFLELHTMPANENLLLLKRFKNKNLKFISISNTLNEDLEKVGLKSITLHDCANIIDKEKITDVELKSKRKIAAGYVGSAFKGKGVEIIIGLAKECLDIDFYIIGVDLSEIPSEMSKSFSENIHFLGRVPHEEVPNYINAFDICLLPNQASVLVGKFFWEEGNERLSSDIGKYTSPLKLFEYMAQGKPIISSNIASISEVLSHKHNALLVKPDDILSWKEALYSIAYDDVIKSKLGITAFKTFAEKYTWSKRVDSYIDQVFKDK